MIRCLEDKIPTQRTLSVNLKSVLIDNFKIKKTTF